MLCRSVRDLPALGSLLESSELAEQCRINGRTVVKFVLRSSLDAARLDLKQGKEVDLGSLLSDVKQRLGSSARGIINATGVVLHTNLGRAPLGDILTKVAHNLRGYSPLEYDLVKGVRGRRGGVVESLLCALTGVESALVVNNCASALLLLLTTHAKGREVVVSRGELVEIGGGFRIPEVLALSGAKLVEVGTTNRTDIEDFSKAIGEQTALLLKTHSSNFSMVGFTKSPTDRELIALGKRFNVPVAYDLGSGMLTGLGIDEPGIIDAVRFPVSVCSGDKLLGGPQCGLMLGEKELVERCRAHPLFRALRCDKVTIALLEEALRLQATDPPAIPIFKLICARAPELEARARRLAGLLDRARIEVVSTFGQVGGGSYPGEAIPSWGISLCPGPNDSVDLLHQRLRLGSPSVVARVEKDMLLIDLRAVFPDEDDELAAAIKRSFT